MISFDDLFAKAMRRPGFRREYALFEEERRLVDLLIDARRAANLTRKALARRMGTKRGAVFRIEGGAESPYLIAVIRYAKAVGMEISLDHASSAAHEPSTANESAAANNPSAPAEKELVG